MRFAFFYPSLTENSNCGTTHFIQSISTQLAEEGDEVKIFDSQTEPPLSTQTPLTSSPLFNHPRIQYHPHLRIPQEWNPFFHEHLDQFDLIIIHEQTPPQLVQALGKLRGESPHFKLLLHDPTHRILSDPARILHLDLKHYDGILTSRKETQRMYLSLGLTDQAWTWPEAIRTEFFKPENYQKKTNDSIHTGINTKIDFENPEFQEYILTAMKEMNLGIKLYGNYTPKSFSIQECRSHIYFRGKAPYTRMPEIYSQSHISFFTPQQPDSASLPRTPSMILLEALACEIPVISTGGDESDIPLTPGKDYLITHHKDETKELIKLLLADLDFKAELTQHARQSIVSHFSASQRAQELREIYQTLAPSSQNPIRFISS